MSEAVLELPPVNTTPEPPAPTPVKEAAKPKRPTPAKKVPAAKTKPAPKAEKAEKKKEPPKVIHLFKVGDKVKIVGGSKGKKGDHVTIKTVRVRYRVVLGNGKLVTFSHKHLSE